MGFGGIRDPQLRPSGCRVAGWQIAADGKTLTALIPPPFVERIIDALVDNGQFAITVEEHPTHVTYQAKGRYVRHRPVEPQDFERVEEIRRRLSRSVRLLVPPGFDVAKILKMFSPDPEVAIEVELREVYLQTPGPQAGSRVYPAPAA